MSEHRYDIRVPARNPREGVLQYIQKERELCSSESVNGRKTGPRQLTCYLTGNNAHKN